MSLLWCVLACSMWSTRDPGERPESAELLTAETPWSDTEPTRELSPSGPAWTTVRSVTETDSPGCGERRVVQRPASALPDCESAQAQQPSITIDGTERSVLRMLSDDPAATALVVFDHQGWMMCTELAVNKQALVGKGTASIFVAGEQPVLIDHRCADETVGGVRMTYHEMRELIRIRQREQREQRRLNQFGPRKLDE